MKLNLLVIEVTPLVVKHVAFCSKCLSASLNAAFEWTLISVDPHVNCEILSFTESLLTAGERTLEGLRSIVKLQMFEQL